MTTIESLISEDYTALDADQRTSKALSQLESSKDIVIVLHDGEYQGVITAEQILRHEVTNQGQKIKTVYKRAPRVAHDTELTEALRLLHEDDLKVLPVFNDGLIGVVHLNDILQAVLNKHTTLTAADVMTEDVTTVSPTTSVKQAIGTLRDLKVSRLPVVDGSPVGLISVYDIVRRFHHPQDRRQNQETNDGRSGRMGEKRSPLGVDVQSIMQRRLITAGPEMNLYKLVQHLIDNDVGSVLITKDNDLRGIVTRRDILYRLVHEYHAEDNAVHVSIASNIDNLGRAELIDMIHDFTEKYASQFGTGHITLHVSRHKERRQGQSLLYGRLHVRTQDAREHLTGEGYGPRHLTRNLLRKLRIRILRDHQNHPEQSTAEFLEHMDMTSL